MSTNKFVTVPEPVQIAGQPYTLKMLVTYLTENEDHFVKSMRGVNAGIRLRELFAKDETGEVVKVHPDDWKPLRDAVDAPSCGYPSWTGINSQTGQQVTIHSAPHIGPLGNAILNATDKAPEKPVEPEPPRVPPANGAALAKPEPQPDDELHAAAV